MDSDPTRLDEAAGLIPSGADYAILAVDKPAGMTSHDVVARIRRATGMKAGHAGTLDPFATGLLLVLLGRATRLQRYLLGLPTRYLATARIGWTSTTGDRDGELEMTGRVPDEISLPVGEMEQMVPMTSAVKVGGEPLYRKAHRGEHREDRPVRSINVEAAELVSLEHGRDGLPERGTFDVLVSSGTYVRNLIETLDDAYCEDLRRTAIGPIELEEEDRFVPLREALSFMTMIELVEEQRREVSYGRSFTHDPGSGGVEGPVCLTFRGSVIATATSEAGLVRPEVVLEPA